MQAIETHSLSMTVELTDDETLTDLDTTASILYSENASQDMQELLSQRETLSSFELLPLCTVVFVGSMFGLCLNKGRIFEPYVIIEQMTFERFIMLKLFLSAAGSSAMVLALSSYLYKAHFVFARAKYRNNFGVLRVMFGAFVLGIGITIAGSCPGMVLVQCGAGVRFSYITLFGLLFGAFLCILMKPLVGTQKRHAQNTPLCHFQFSYTFIDEFFIGNMCLNYRKIAILFGVFCWIIVGIFECIWPWQSELTIPNTQNCNFLTCTAWPPQVCGLIIGVLQMPLIAVFGNALGCSTSYVCIMSQWLRYCHPKVQQIFVLCVQNELDKFWQIILILSVIFGSWMTVALAEQPLNVIRYPYQNIESVNELRAFCGGILMIFGSRIAGGCSSGHGLSGFGLLNVYSMFAIAAMFGGAIITAHII